MIRGKKVEIDKPTPVNINIKASIHNRFDIEVIDSITGEVKQTAVAYNIILDAMWTRFLDPSTSSSTKALWNKYIHYGSGTGTPSPTRTSLFTFVGAKQSDRDYYYSGHSPIWVRKKITILENEYVGTSFSEVGIGYSDSSSSLMTHAMLQDSNGNQISIVKTNTDIINIYATVYLYYNNHNYDGIYFCYAPGSNNFYTRGVCRLLGDGSINEIPFRYMTLAQYPTKTRVTTSSILSQEASVQTVDNGYVYSNSSYSFNSSLKKLSVSYSRVPAANRNVYGGINSIFIYTSSTSTTGSSITGVPVLCIPTKALGPWHITNETIGTGDGTTKDFALDFALASNAKIYVNGVEQTSGVSVSKIPYMVSSGDLTYWLEEFIPYGDLEIPYVTGFSAFEYSSINGDNWRPSANEFFYFKNPYDLSVDVFTFSDITEVQDLQCSNDKEAWYNISFSTSSSIVNIPSQYKYYKYFRFKRIPKSSGGDWGNITKVTSNDFTSNKAVHFDAAPASGDIITASYDTDCLPKDANHVFDLSLTISFGEYTD